MQSQHITAEWFADRPLGIARTLRHVPCVVERHGVSSASGVRNLLDQECGNLFLRHKGARPPSVWRSGQASGRVVEAAYRDEAWHGHPGTRPRLAGIAAGGTGALPSPGRRTTSDAVRGTGHWEYITVRTQVPESRARGSVGAAFEGPQSDFVMVRPLLQGLEPVVVDETLCREPVGPRERGV